MRALVPVGIAAAAFWGPIAAVQIALPWSVTIEEPRPLAIVPPLLTLGSFLFLRSRWRSARGAAALAGSMLLGIWLVGPLVLSFGVALARGDFMLSGLWGFPSLLYPDAFTMLGRSIYAETLAGLATVTVVLAAIALVGAGIASTPRLAPWVRRRIGSRASGRASA